MKKLARSQWWYLVITLASAVGLIASFLQLLEKINLLKHPGAYLYCNLNSVFNCSNILNAHQSSVFGFPNSILCIIFFSILISAGLVGLTGSQIHKYLRYFFQFLAVFFAGFGFWYLWQSIFNVGAICIFCLFCYGGVLALNASWFRLNYHDYPLSNKALSQLDRIVANGVDIFFWCLIGLAIILEALIKFNR